MLVYHGGAPGLLRGQWITPREPGDTQHLIDGCARCEARRRGEPLVEDLLDPSLVYVCTDRLYAMVFANGYPKGALYRVDTGTEPLFEAPDDPNDTGSFGVRRARVVGVLDPLVVLRPAQLRKALQRWT